MSCDSVKGNKRNITIKPTRLSKSFNDETTLSRSLKSKNSSKNLANKRLLALRKTITEDAKREKIQSKKEDIKNKSLAINDRRNEENDETQCAFKKFKSSSKEDLEITKKHIPTAKSSTSSLSSTFSNLDNILEHTIIGTESTNKPLLESYSISNNIHSINEELFKATTNKTNLGSTIEDTTMEWDSMETELLITDNLDQENICIATDTNVFLHYLHKIKDIINFQASGNIKIYIPWMVVTELDFMKHNSKNSIKTSAIKAIEFINTHLEANNPKIIGQSVEAATKQKDVGVDPDDKILSSCLQIAKKFKTVILLSNDCNLRNKALMSNLEAASSQNIMQKLLFKTRKNTKSMKIVYKLSVLCTQIITDCCKEAYGDIWNKMDMLDNPPWSLLDCLKRITRYWKSVFKELLLKQCLPRVTVLQEILEANSGFISDDSEVFSDFTKNALEFLIFLKDIPSGKSQVKACIDEIISIAN